MTLPILRETADTVRIFDPTSGEELDLSLCNPATLAMLRDVIRDAEEEQRIAKKQIDAEVLRRMDFERKWTMHADGFTLTSSSPEPTVVIDDPAALHAELMAFVDDGTLSVDAVNAAIEQVIDYKARKRGLDALRKGGGPVADVIAAREKEIAPPRRVTVKKAA